MNLDQLAVEIKEREVLLDKLDKSNPLYPIMELELLKYKERYELTKMSEGENRSYRT